MRRLLRLLQFGYDVFEPAANGIEHNDALVDVHSHTLSE
jgi:hypothetical protein